ncbi:electron transport complex subunit E [Candidatus Woesearchaeota archaeon]|nr:electron transport complex subunit E [Candidatus Woesearchaeota archaeon]
MEKKDILLGGILQRNPVFTMMLGLCPVLAVTTSLENGLGMGLSAMFVLMFSNPIISSLRNVIPDRIRIPSFIVIIATFVTIVSLLMQAYLPALNDRLGIYVPLIVVNCIILGRAEVFARRNSIFDSLLDAVGMGIGFTLALIVIGSVRELLGSGSIAFWGYTLSAPIEGAIVMILPAGALMTIGLIIALRNYIRMAKATSGAGQK